MIGIITYDAPHRKTQDVLFKLILNGYSNLHLIGIPWIKRKNFQPIYEHRPVNKMSISIEKLAERLNITYSKVAIKDLETYFSKQHFKHILIAGAGLLPESLCKSFKIINAHPGYLPYTKGLDAFKWAILRGHPIGVTTHYISEKADEGLLIEKRIVPVYFEDTFGGVAYRVYETEIEMLVNAIGMIEENKATFEALSDDNYVANKRMPHHHEIVMMQRFNEMIRKSDSRSAKELKK